MAKRHEVLCGDSTRPSNEPLISRIDNAFSKFAERIAAVDAGNGQRVSFAEIHSRARKVTQRLEQIITSTCIVGLALEPSVDLLVASIAVVQRGLTYVAIDPALPLERLRYIIQNSKVVAILHAGDLQQRDEIDTDLIDLRDDVTEAARKIHKLPPVVDDKPMCIFYTSGSAGKPKAVPITWSMLRNRMEWQWRAFAFDQHDVVCAKTKIGFLDSLCETWAPFLVGTPIVYVKSSIMMDIARLVAVLDDFKVTRMTLVPSMLRALLVTLRSSNTKLGGLRYIISSGEALEYDLCEMFFDILPHCSLVNFYGSTEMMADVLAVTFKSLKDVRARSRGQQVSIGFPIDNTTAILYDVDDNGIGELVVAGPNVFGGYLRSDSGEPTGVFSADDLDLEQILEANQQVFRTGDRCQLSSDELIFLGRGDRQIKIAGNRLDLSEVETALAESANFVTPPVVVFTGERIFTVYLQQENLDTCLNLEQLKSRLPRYALPEFLAVTQYPQFPTSGKINRQRLVEMCIDSMTSNSDHYNWVDFTELDDVLGYPAINTKLVIEVMTLVGVRAPSLDILMRRNFFETGGSSLNAIQAVALLKERKLHITMKSFLLSPTIGHLIRCITNADAGPDTFRSVLPSDWSLHALGETGWEDAAQLIARGFMDCCMPVSCEGTDLYTCECRFEEVLTMARAVRPYCLPPGKDISFGLFNKEMDLLGVFMNFADDFQPTLEEFPSSTYLGQTLLFIDAMERPTLAKLKAKGYKHILHSFLIAVDKFKLKNPEDAVQSILAMEFHLLDMAQKAGFDAILAINTHPATQQAAEFVLGYKIDRIVGGPKSGPDKPGQCFAVCECENSVVQVCYKELKEP